ncbi:MAG: redoxin domain-containing protein [bacterium]
MHNQFFKISFFVWLFLNTIAVFPQTVKIFISDLPSNKAAVFSLSGEKTFFLDSVFTNSPGMFEFETDETKYRNGFYRLSLSGNKSVDFIFDENNVELKTDANNILDSMKAIKSVSNKLYYSFVKLNKEYKTKTELLQLILARYPKDDDYYSATQNKLIEVQNQYLDFVRNTSQTNPNSFIARYILSSQLPVILLNIAAENQLAYLKLHALDNVDFTDAGLINSDVFTNKTIEYLTYFRNPQFPKELLEKEFMAAVDSVLNRAKVNELVYQHITEYLVDGFKKFGFDLVIDYIVENYVIKDDLCLDVKTEGLIKRRIEQAKKFKIGMTVPDIIMPDLNGNTVELNKLTAEKVLIVFYASWCPHCEELLPKLNELQAKQKEKLEILTVSLDSSKTDWQNFVKNNSSSCTNLFDGKGWDGKAASDYFIYATPSMFLVDKDKKVIAKPMSYEEVIQSIK